MEQQQVSESRSLETLWPLLDATILYIKPLKSSLVVVWGLLMESGHCQNPLGATKT